jgi:hypothetical protein
MSGLSFRCVIVWVRYDPNVTRYEKQKIEWIRINLSHVDLVRFVSGFQGISSPETLTPDLEPGLFSHLSLQCMEHTTTPHTNHLCLSVTTEDTSLDPVLLVLFVY